MSDEKCLIHFRFSAHLCFRSCSSCVQRRRKLWYTEEHLLLHKVTGEFSTVENTLDSPEMDRSWTNVPQACSSALRDFLGCIVDFVLIFEYLLIISIVSRYAASKEKYWTDKVTDRVPALSICIGYINEIVLEIARPDDASLQTVVHNVH